MAYAPRNFGTFWDIRCLRPSLPCAAICWLNAISTSVYNATPLQQSNLSPRLLRIEPPAYPPFWRQTASGTDAIPDSLVRPARSPAPRLAYITTSAPSRTVLPSSLQWSLRTVARCARDPQSIGEDPVRASQPQAGEKAEVGLDFTQRSLAQFYAVGPLASSECIFQPRCAERREKPCSHRKIFFT